MKRCYVCGKEIVRFSLCSDCWLALKLLNHDLNRIQKCAKYVLKLGAKKIAQFHSSPPWKVAKQKKELRQQVTKRTQEYLKSEKLRRAEIEKSKRIKVVRNGEIVKVKGATQ